MFGTDDPLQLGTPSDIDDRADPPTTLQRILIVSPGRLLREGLQQLLAQPGRVFIGDCRMINQVEQALDVFALPDLIVVSIDQAEPATEVLAEIRSLRERVPGTRWILLARHTELPFLREAIETGIDGLLLEDSSATVLRLVTELVLLGQSFVPTELARLLGDGAKPQANGQDRPLRLAEPAAPISPWVGMGRRAALSEREAEVLRGLVAGHSNKLVARECGIAEATVKAHVKALMRKMQVTNRTQAVIMALQMLSAPEPKTEAFPTSSPGLKAMSLALPAECPVSA